MGLRRTFVRRVSYLMEPDSIAQGFTATSDPTDLVQRGDDAGSEL